MYHASPPTPGDQGSSAGTAPLLRISGAARQVFSKQADAARDPAYHAYLTDLVSPCGLSVDADALARGQGQSYGDMASALLGRVAPAGRPADLLVMAFAVPDVTPWRSTASYLSHLCPGSPMAFAVCDCGTTAGFTALRLIRAHSVGAGAPRALLIVLEQAAINHELPVPAATPARHAAVALRFDRAGFDQAGSGQAGADPAGGAVVNSVWLQAGVARSEAGRLLAAGLARLSAGHADVTVIAGEGLAQAAFPAAPEGAGEVIIAPAGQPCTGVWWEVAGRLANGAVRGRRVLLADYDPLAGSLCLAAIDVTGSAPPR